jgi:hypothetical protein
MTITNGAVYDAAKLFLFPKTPESYTCQTQLLTFADLLYKIYEITTQQITVNSRKYYSLVFSGKVKL